MSIPGSPFLIGGMTQADISNMFPTAITPAGFTFSIWSLIYLSWIVAWIYALKNTLKKDKRFLIIFSLAIFLTAIWLIPWGFQMIWTSLLLMLLILGLLKYAFRLSRSAHPTLKYSIELTLGWINIATVANITIYLVSLGFTGGGISETYWAIWILGLALVLTAYYQCRFRSYIISLVFLWTMLWEWFTHDTPAQRYAILLYSVITIFNMVYSYFKNKKTPNI
jgi:TspO/MBR family